MTTNRNEVNQLKFAEVREENLNVGQLKKISP